MPGDNSPSRPTFALFVRFWPTSTGVLNLAQFDDVPDDRIASELARVAHEWAALHPDELRMYEQERERFHRRVEKQRNQELDFEKVVPSPPRMQDPTLRIFRAAGWVEQAFDLAATADESWERENWMPCPTRGFWLGRIDSERVAREAAAALLALSAPISDWPRIGVVDCSTSTDTHIAVLDALVSDLVERKSTGGYEVSARQLALRLGQALRTSSTPPRTALHVPPSARVGARADAGAHAATRQSRAETSPKPAEEKAWSSYEWALKEKPELDPSPKVWTKAIWEYIREHDCPSYPDADGLPNYETWQRYAREGRRHAEGPRNSSRHGREHGGSIVRADEI